MAEMNADSGQESAPAQSIAQPMVQSSEAPVSEKMLPQSQVDYIAHEANKRGYEKARKEFAAQQAQQAAPSQQSSTWNSGNNVGMGGMSPQFSKQQVRETIEEYQREQMGQHMANTFLQKLNVGVEKTPEMKAALSQVNYEKIPEIVNWATQLPNTAEIMYELIKTNKLGQLHNMVSLAPGKVYEELVNISDSIANNSIANQTRTPNEPLSQLKPSTVGTGVDNGKTPTVTDYKKKYRG
jgi:hypothetical protein